MRCFFKIWLVVLSMNFSIKEISSQESSLDQAKVSIVEYQKLYRGFDNKVKITVPGYRTDKMKVSCSGGELASTKEDDIYTLNRILAKIITVQVSVIEKNGNVRELENKRMRTYSVPYPVVFVDGSFVGNKRLSPESINEISIVDTSELKINYGIITEFSLYIKCDKGLVVVKANGNQLSSNQKLAISNNKCASKFTLSGIKIEDDKGKKWQFREV